VLGEEALCLRMRAPDPAEDRLVVTNLGRDLPLVPAPEPLLAPPRGMRWAIVWSSESPKYGGLGTPDFDTDGPPVLPGGCTVLLAGRRT
jgi:maltooligosyltrehalose trehalohydrolase